MSQPASFPISVESGDRTLVAVDDFSFAYNEITFLFGESGIGKSLLCKAAYGLLYPDELRVSMGGQSYESYLADPRTEAIRKNGFFVFQEPSSHLNPLRRITDQLNEGSISGQEGEGEILGTLWQTSDDSAVRQLLEVYPKPYRPSGGEKQRVLLAMAFKRIVRYLQSDQKSPALFVFDEPTGSLDNNYRNLFLRLLFEKFSVRPFTVLLITHDYSIISEVMRGYGHVREKIHFKELSRVDDNGRVVLKDFSAGQYLTWLDQARGRAVTGTGEPVLHFQSSFSVFGRKLRIFADEQHRNPVDMTIGRGEMVYVRAPSGVGKTTLAKVVLGLYPADSFQMTLCGKKVTERSSSAAWQGHIWGKHAGMVFQHADEALDMESTVKETFDGLPGYKRLTSDAGKTKLLELFDGPISDSFLGKKVKYLSGGQKQRLNLLRTLSLGTDLIILDEPLNALDFVSIQKVLALLEQKQKAGASFLLISHNEEIFEALVDRSRTYYLAEEGGR